MLADNLMETVAPRPRSRVATGWASTGRAARLDDGRRSVIVPPLPVGAMCPVFAYIFREHGGIGGVGRWRRRRILRPWRRHTIIPVMAQALVASPFVVQHMRLLVSTGNRAGLVALTAMIDPGYVTPVIDARTS